MLTNVLSALRNIFLCCLCSVCDLKQYVDKRIEILQFPKEYTKHRLPGNKMLSVEINLYQACKKYLKIYKGGTCWVFTKFEEAVFR